MQGQLDGTVPSTTEGQTANPDGLVFAGIFNLTDLGSMMGGRGDRGNIFGENQNENNGQSQFSGAGGNIPNMQLMQQAAQLIEEAGGEITDEVREKLLELGLSEDEITMLANMQGGFGGGFPQGQIGNQTNAAGNFPDNNQNNRLPGQSENNTPFTQPEASSKLSNPYSLYLAGVLVLILISATVFAAKQKKNY